jgi:hypothetical protein
MECPGCGGEGCTLCGGSGVMTVDQCPLLVIDRETLDVIELAEFAAKGHFPVAGGVLDQAHSFLAACRFVWAEEAYWKRVTDPLNAAGNRE